MINDYLEVTVGTGVQVALDLRWMGLPADLDARLAAPLARAWSDLVATESSGDIVNADEHRRVGHYWLRAPEFAPALLAAEIEASWREVATLVGRLANRFECVLVVGIGGSALGPQLLADALEKPGDQRKVAFLDNTDPDGVARVLRQQAPLSEVLVVVISKSGGTPETRNGFLLVREAYEAEGLVFEQHVVAVTQEGSGRCIARPMAGSRGCRCGTGSAGAPR